MRYEIKVSISKFLFGTPKVIYQNKLIGVVGGVLGRLMLKFHHNYAGFSAHILSNADNSAHMLKIQQHQYHKLKNTVENTHSKLK